MGAQGKEEGMPLAQLKLRCITIGLMGRSFLSASVVAFPSLVIRCGTHHCGHCHLSCYSIIFEPTSTDIFTTVHRQVLAELVVAQKRFQVGRSPIALKQLWEKRARPCAAVAHPQKGRVVRERNRSGQTARHARRTCIIPGEGQLCNFKLSHQIILSRCVAAIDYGLSYSSGIEGRRQQNRLRATCLSSTYYYSL
jgi:hypothetical protein